MQADWAEEGIFLLFLFVFISRHVVFIARTICALLNVTVAALRIRSVQQCDQSSERRCSWKTSVVFNSAQVYPQSGDLNQIQLIIATLYLGPYRAGLWVSMDSILNLKQNNSKQEERNTA